MGTMKKYNFRINYDIILKEVFDGWFGYNLSDKLELRFGRTWVWFVGDIIDNVCIIETIDYPVVSDRLFYPRYDGVFLFHKDKYFRYNFGLVNGSGFKKEEDKNKDFIGSFCFQNYMLKMQLGIYLGSYKNYDKNRIVFGIEYYLYSSDLEIVWVKGEDLRVKSEGGYFRLTNHFMKSIDGLIEYDFLKREIEVQYLLGMNKREELRYLVLGINKFVNSNIRIQFNYRKLFSDYGKDLYNDTFQVQLQFVY